MTTRAVEKGSLPLSFAARCAIKKGTLSFFHILCVKFFLRMPAGR